MVLQRQDETLNRIKKSGFDPLNLSTKRRGNYPNIHAV